MGSFRIFPILLLSCFLFLFLSHGFVGAEVMGSSVKVTGSVTPKKENENVVGIGKGRKMMVNVADYHDPRPNRPPAFGYHMRFPSPPAN